MGEMLPRYSRQETSPVFSEAGFQANNGALEIETVIYLPLLSLSESMGIHIGFFYYMYIYILLFS